MKRSAFCSLTVLLVAALILPGFANANPPEREIILTSYASGSVAYVCFYATSEYINKDRQTITTYTNPRRAIKRTSRIWYFNVA